MKYILFLLVILSFTFSNAQTFSDTPGDSISDDGTTECYDLTVAGVGNIDEIFGLGTVCLSINHGWVGELEVSLVSPDGTTFALTEMDFGIWGNTGFTSTCFEQDASLVLDSGSDPYTGTFIPRGAMYSVNNGQNADGVWQLCIRDRFTGTRGFLESWSIDFNNNPAVQPPLGPQDCPGAIPVCDGTYDEVNSYVGTGLMPDEVDGLNSCLGGETNSVWYTFTVEGDGDLNFSITPNDLSNDYDWAVYDITSSTCADIYTDASLEISCNYYGGGGVTGANGGTTGAEEPLITAYTGQVLTVLIDNYSGSGSGYNLSFTQSTADIYDDEAPTLDSIGNILACGIDTVTFAFSENVLCSTISDADLVLNGPAGVHTISGLRSDNCALGGDYDRTYTFDVSPALSTMGTYTLSLAPGAAIEDNCGNTIDITGSLDFGLEPMAVVKDSTMITCFGLTDGVATITSTSGQSPITYAWDDGATQATSAASGLAVGTYNVLITDALGCTATETVNITEPTQIVVSTVDSDQSCFGVCDGTSLASATGGTMTSGSYTYAWNDSGLTLGSLVSNLCQGTYDVSVTDDNGCSETVSATINEPASMIIDTTVVQSTCNQATGSIQLTIPGGNSPYDYAWTNSLGASVGGNGDNLSGIAADTYNVTVTDSRGCTATETIPVVSLYEHFISATLISDALCYGDCNGEVSTTITGFGTTFSYTWVDQSNGSNTGILTSSTNTLCAGTYEITSTESVTGCFDTAVITVGSPAQMQMTASNDTTICENGCAYLEIETTGGALPITHIWTVDFVSYDLGDAQTYCPTSPTNYYIIASDANSCIEVDSVRVDKFNPLTVAISANSTTICEGDSVVLTANMNGGNGNYTYDWDGNSSSSGQFIAYPNGSTLFSVDVSDNCESDPTTDLISITVNTLPTINITTHGEGCAPYTAKFTSTITPNPVSYTLRYGDGLDSSFASFTDTVSHYYTEAGVYDIHYSVLTSEGCIADSIFSQLLEVHANPKASFYVSKDTVSDVFAQVCFYDQSSDYDSLKWIIDNDYSNTEAFTCYTGDTIGCYQAKLYAKNNLGCIDSLSRKVCIKEQSSIFVPTAFSPNDDGHNNCFKPMIRGSQLSTYCFQIFDRWGSLLYETKSIYDCWDGRINGQKPVVGVYVYKLWYKDNEGENIRKVGHVTIVP